jgi:hypothetical protein
MRRATAALGLLLAHVFATATPTRHLFLDPGFLTATENAKLAVNPAEPREIVIRPDRSWEKLMISLFLTVREEEGKLRMWYICRDAENRPNLAYAESVDGVHWEKPALGLVDHDGNRANNLVGIPNLEGVVVRDDRVPPAERYVYITNIYSEGLVRFFSPDGLRWSRDAQPLLRFESDTQNVLFRDERLGKYVLYLRGWDPGTDTARLRKVVRLEFDDYRQPLALKPSGRPTHPVTALKTRLPWIVDEMPTVLQVDDRDPPMTDIYNLSAQPYPPDPSWYAAFPAFYRHRAESDEPPYENSGRTEVQFAGSRDGIRWHRYDRRAYAAPALFPGERGNMIYMGTGLVVRGDEIWQYGTAFRTEHGDLAGRKQQTDGVIVRYVQRIDGFVSLNTGDVPGSARTAPVTVNGNRLRLNLDPGALGELRVGLLDDDGKPLPGFSLDKCDPLQRNETGATVTWDGRGDLGILQGRAVRLAFVSTRTKLYSFRFE